MPRPLLNAAVATALAVPTFGAAQDVEMLGRHYGTPVPRAYYEAAARDPEAFSFARGRALRTRARMEAVGRAEANGWKLVLGPRDGPVEGVVSVPLVLGLFADDFGSGPFSSEEIQGAYFGRSGATVSTYFDEVSRGRVDFRGVVHDWVRARPTYTRDWVTNGSSGLTTRTGAFIKSLLDGLPDVDWGVYDSDGPDGVPNSGDDDGYVDALAVMHPTPGAECGGSGSGGRIWSHKWNLSAGGSPYVTGSPAAGGGFIRVDDYFIQSARSCVGPRLNEIGVFSHEAGHAFGLPDLYDTDQSDGTHQGAGNWELMASGGWGCDNLSPERPCHMGAWSKAMLGWADVVDVPAGTDMGSVVIPPVETSGVIYRVAASDGSGEYFLLENRQRFGFDTDLKGAGLLVWQIDADFVAGRWTRNQVNGSEHMGVWLRQADGLEQLSLSGPSRGDAGDPYPYGSGLGENRFFHAGSTPASTAFEAGGTGVTLRNIERVGTDIRLDVLTRMTRVGVRSQGAEMPQGLLTVNEQSVPATGVVLAAPYEPLVVRAAPGESLGPGIRRPFVDWADGERSGERVLDTPLQDIDFVARYGGRQVELAVGVTGGVDGVEPATFTTQPESPDLWFEEGTFVTIEARPRTGFDFVGWGGALAGRPNPATVVVTGPLEADADFRVIYAVTAVEGTLEAARIQELKLVAENANLPVAWTLLEGPLPRGLSVDDAGRIHGAALETGTYRIRVRGTDAIGLTGAAEVTLHVADPALSIEALASPFLLSGPPLTELQEHFLDLQGDDDGSYDLGDFRAWILSHPDLPMTATASTVIAAPLELRVPFAARKEDLP